MTVNELLQQGYKLLKSAGIDGYHTDAQLILAKALSAVRLFVLTNPCLPVQNADEYLQNIKKRADGCPLAYITGFCEFYGREFKVTKDTLIPRADTEVLTGEAIKHIGTSKKEVLEIGTGSGCIAVTLALELPYINVTAVDISQSALNIAKQNAQNLNAEVNFIKSDIYSALDKTAPFDIIISNPPYIKTTDIPALPVSVKAYEPITALDGGASGLDFYKAIAKGAEIYLKRGGLVLFEIGYNQAEEVSAVLTERGFADITITKDNAGHSRVIKAKFGGKHV